MNDDALPGAPRIAPISQAELLRLRREGVQALHAAFARQAERAREGGIKVEGLGGAELGLGGVRFRLRREGRVLSVEVLGVRAGRADQLRAAAGIATATVAAGPEAAPASEHRLVLVREGPRADWHVYSPRRIAYRLGANHLRRFVAYLTDPGAAAPALEFEAAADSDG